MAITKTFDILNINGVKGYIRDSWARRKIVALQSSKQDALTTGSATITTNSSGCKQLFSGTDKKILCAWADPYIVEPFIYHGNTWVRVMTYTGNLVTSTSVTVNYIGV